MHGVSRDGGNGAQGAVDHARVGGEQGHLAQGHLPTQDLIAHVVQDDEFTEAHEELQKGHEDAPHTVGLFGDFPLLRGGGLKPLGLPTLHTEGLDHADAREDVVEHGVGLGRALPSAVVELAHGAPEEAEGDHHEGGGEHDQEEEPRVVHQHDDAHGEEQEQLLQKAGEVVDEEALHLGGVSRHAVHEVARGAAGDLGDGELLDLLKEQIPQIHDHAVAGVDEQVALDHGQAADQQLDSQHGEDHQHEGGQRDALVIGVLDVVVHQDLVNIRKEEVQTADYEEQGHRAEHEPLVGLGHIPEPLDHLFLAGAVDTDGGTGAVGASALGTAVRAVPLALLELQYLAVL